MCILYYTVYIIYVYILYTYMYVYMRTHLDYNVILLCYFNLLYVIYIIYMYTGECLWLHLDLIAKVLGDCRALFPSVKYGYTTIPTYPSGQIGFIIATKDATLDLAGEIYDILYTLCILVSCITLGAYMICVIRINYIHYAYILFFYLPTTVPSRPVPAAMASTLRYYSSDIHKVHNIYSYTYTKVCTVTLY